MNFLIIIAIVLITCLLYFILIGNKLIKLNNEIKEAFATMDVYLKKRWDLIPNIIATVKEYEKHEKKVFKDIIEIRNGKYDDLSYEEKIKNNEQLTKGINKIIALVEAYPELKTNSNFLELQKSLNLVEDEIAQSRKYYNATVRMFNNLVEMIPSNLVAKFLGYSTKNMFEGNVNERENVQVKF